MSALRLLLLSAVVVLLSIGTMTEAMRRGSAPKMCCFDFATQPVKVSQVKSYIRTSQQCSNKAVMFTMKRGRQVCARPSEPWVQEHIKILDLKTSGSNGPLFTMKRAREVCARPSEPWVQEHIKILGQRE